MNDTPKVSAQLRNWRRFTRCCWQLLIPAILGLTLGIAGMWAGALAALGPGLGRGVARSQRRGQPDPWSALAEAAGAAMLAGIVAGVAAVAGAWTVACWAALALYRGYQAVAPAFAPRRLSLARR